jgi:hypothetical protein
MTRVIYISTVPISAAIDELQITRRGGSLMKLISTIVLLAFAVALSFQTKDRKLNQTAGIRVPKLSFVSITVRS